MTLAPHAAIVRGDDFHFYFGWLCVARALKDPDIESISIEDADSGSFDDVVVLRRSGRNEFFQLKSSNSAASTIDETWLTSKKNAKTKSTLQKLFGTWSELRHNTSATFAIVTNKGLDVSHPLLKLKDNHSDTIGKNARKESLRSKSGKALVSWANHVGCPPEEMLEFLDVLEWRSEGAERATIDRCVDAMRAAGLRSDIDAVHLGADIVRRWVKEGSGPRNADQMRQAVAANGLLASTGRLVLAVHALDKRPSTSLALPNVECDLVDLYEEVDTRARRSLVPSDWNDRIKPCIADATRVLESYGLYHVHVTGSLRLPMWFTVGHYLPEVRGWTLSCDQRGIEWDTVCISPNAPSVVANHTEIGAGSELAVGISLTSDVQPDVVKFIDRARLPVQSLLNLTVPGGARMDSVEDGAHSNGWARAARQAIYAKAKELRPARIHLFIAAPGGTALMLGHHWNMMPSTTVYEHLLYDDYIAGPSLS